MACASTIEEVSQRVLQQLRDRELSFASWAADQQLCERICVWAALE